MIEKIIYTFILFSLGHPNSQSGHKCSSDSLNFGLFVKIENCFFFLNFFSTKKFNKEDFFIQKFFLSLSDFKMGMVSGISAKMTSERSIIVLMRPLTIGVSCKATKGLSSLENMMSGAITIERFWECILEVVQFVETLFKSEKRRFKVIRFVRGSSEISFLIPSIHWIGFFECILCMFKNFG